jgi:GNAT superfamily N-acetyltransferase
MCILISECAKSDILYDIFCESLPFLGLGRDKFNTKINAGDTVITAGADCKTVGFCVCGSGGIKLLCVLPAYWHRGIGSKLLSCAEDALGAEITLGRSGSGYLIQGVPYTYDMSAVRFFEKRGYHADWTSADMSMALSSFDMTSLIPPPAGIIFGYAVMSDAGQLTEAVASVIPSWLPYFREMTNVFTAKQNGQIIGFELLTLDSGRTPLTEGITYDRNVRTGEIGCVGVIPSKRGFGVGLNMVARGTLELIKQNCEVGFIGYTHLEHWYAKLGYRTCVNFWMGQKNNAR